MFVLDIETTGFKGQMLGDVIIEIAIYKVNKEEIKFVYHTYIDPTSYDNLNPNWTNAWIFKNSSITTAKILQYGQHYVAVKPKVEQLLNNQYVTSYNTNFDLKKYLCKPPWNIKPKPYPCLMKSVSSHFNCKWLKLADAVEKLQLTEYTFQGDCHTASYDAYLASVICQHFLKLNWK